MSSVVLDTIKKLLRLANDEGATEGEVQAALNRVALLAQKHNISDVEIERAQRADGTEGVRINIDPKDVVEACAYAAKNLTRWDRWLSVAVANATTTGTYSSWRSFGRAIIFYGLPQDVAVAVELYAYVRKALSRCARRWAKEQRQDGRVHVQSNSPPVRTYKDGFCGGLIDKTHEQRDAARVDKTARLEAQVGDCTALVLIADVQRAKENALVVKRARLNLRKGRQLGSRAWGGQDAYGAGQAAGRATNLSRSTLNGGS